MNKEYKAGDLHREAAKNWTKEAEKLDKRAYYLTFEGKNILSYKNKDIESIYKKMSDNLIRQSMAVEEYAELLNKLADLFDEVGAKDLEK